MAAAHLGRRLTAAAKSSAGTWAGGEWSAGGVRALPVVIWWAGGARSADSAGGRRVVGQQCAGDGLAIFPFFRFQIWREREKYGDFTCILGDSFLEICNFPGYYDFANCVVEILEKKSAIHHKNMKNHKGTVVILPLGLAMEWVGCGLGWNTPAPTPRLLPRPRPRGGGRVENATRLRPRSGPGG